MRQGGGVFLLILKRGILVFSTGLVAKMDLFYCLVAKMRPFIVRRPN